MFAGPSSITSGIGPARRPRSRRSGSLCADVVALRPLAGGDAAGLVDEFCRRYPNPKTAADYRSTLGRLFLTTGRDHPSELTEGDLISFCAAGDPANNTVYQRVSKVAAFTDWCVRQGAMTGDPAGELRGPRSPLRTYRRTYGKVQAANPGRWLTYEEAYGQLVGSCQDGTIVGLRDEMVIRLGLLGMRLSEIASLDIDNLRQLPAVTWTGKGHKPRRMTAGPALREVLDRYLGAYADRSPGSPLVCREVLGAARRGGPHRLDWGNRARPRTIFVIVAGRARSAGLGHVAPHDLRRTAAGILHRAVGSDGGHQFDLLDIQRVLGHSDPATTMRSYLEPMSTDVLDRAAGFLD